MIYNNIRKDIVGAYEGVFTSITVIGYVAVVPKILV